jgi:hypothetical protein
MKYVFTEVSLREYVRLAHLIDTNISKWKIGLNIQIIDARIYYFYYYGFNDYDIIKIMEVRDERFRK